MRQTNRCPKLTLALGAVAVVSITLNLLLIGGLFGQKAGEPRRMERGLITQMAGSVPPDVRPHLREAIRERRGELRGNFREMRAARRQVSEALAAAEFSEAELLRAFSTLRTQTDAAQRVMHDAMTDTTTRLTLEQRRAWAEHQWRRRRLPSEGMTEDASPGQSSP